LNKHFLFLEKEILENGLEEIETGPILGLSHSWARLMNKSIPTPLLPRNKHAILPLFLSLPQSTSWKKSMHLAFENQARERRK